MSGYAEEQLRKSIDLDNVAFLPNPFRSSSLPRPRATLWLRNESLATNGSCALRRGHEQRPTASSIVEDEPLIAMMLEDFLDCSASRSPAPPTPSPTRWR